MKSIVIRECAIDALTELRSPVTAGALFLAICCEAFGDEAPDFDGDTKSPVYDYGTHALPAVYAAIAPDIKASVEDDGEPCHCGDSFDIPIRIGVIGKLADREGEDAE